MGDEISEEQLLEFCQRLGLARNGYLDEKDLSVVCKCIGVEVPAEKIVELFEELDGDKDGKICLAELSQMFRGMQNRIPSSPERIGKIGDNQPTTDNFSKNNGFFPSNLVEKSTFTVLDPDNTGFTKVGSILDMWSQLGISQDDGLHILNEMGFQMCSRSSSVNLQLFTKAIEDELDHFSEVGIPITVQIALLTYRTEAQYLRSTGEGMETERDKLRQDIFEAHQRSTLLAVEIDEQNSRLEKTNQALIQKMESKYNEQIQELQRRYSLEKDCLQQTIHSLESQQNLLREEEGRQRALVASLTQENSNLEKEVQALTQDIRNVNRLKEQLEREVSRFLHLENRLIEMEKRNSENNEKSESELRKAHSDVQTLRDQNDELSVRLEGMKETLHSMKATEEKRYFVKRRKGVFPISSAFSNKDISDENQGVPLEKVGKYNQQIDVNMLDSSFDEQSTHLSLQSLQSQTDSENPQLFCAISLAACMGESSTDHFSLPDRFKANSSSTKSFQTESDINLDPHYKSLENEMDSVKQKIVTILTEKELLLKENDILRSQCIASDSSLAFLKCPRTDASTQTLNEQSSDVSQSIEDVKVTNLHTEIVELESKLESTKEALVKEKEAHQSQCANYEKSLELLQNEYEKCEEYWHNKLQEAREEYELDRNSSDDKFDELALKIQEYEDMFLKQSDILIEKLPPIAECASLERQVNDLEDECQLLRNELVSVKISHEAAIENLQQKCEAKVDEECGHLEQQVSVLSDKCHEYESRLSILAEEERSNHEDTGILNMLKDRIQHLEFQLKDQDEKNREHVQDLKKIWKEKEDNLKRHILAVSTQSIVLPGEVPPRPSQNTALLEVLQHPKSETFPQCPNHSGMSSSLPYFSAEELNYQVNGFGFDGMTSPNFTPSVWGSQAPHQGKKAWCHVELGWLQGLRSKLKQRDEQCIVLQRSLHQKDFQTEKIISDLKDQHASELSKWESLLKGNQELNRQHALKHREQAEQLAHANLMLKDLWIENSKLMAALNTTEQRVIQLENLLKFQMNAMSKNSTNNNNSNAVASTSAQHSLPHAHHHHFNNN